MWKGLAASASAELWLGGTVPERRPAALHFNELHREHGPSRTGYCRVKKKIEFYIYIYMRARETKNISCLSPLKRGDLNCSTPGCSKLRIYINE